LIVLFRCGVRRAPQGCARVVAHPGAPRGDDVTAA
jgi:hypothetical protein